MNINSAFPSKYLRAADLNNQTVTATIEKVTLEDVGDDRRLVVHFAGKEKGLVLNKTNANAISDLLDSEDTDDWAGRKIRLIVVKVDYQGKRVPAIRIEEASATAAAAPVRRQEPVEPPNEDDIPFTWLLPLLAAAGVLSQLVWS